LKILPELLEIRNRSIEIRPLSTLVAAAQKQHDRPTVKRVVHAITRSNVDRKFPNAFPTECMVPKISRRHSVNAPKYSGMSAGVAHSIKPTLYWVALVDRLIVP
jgi:hypothetical protein